MWYLWMTDETSPGHSKVLKIDLGWLGTRIPVRKESYNP